MCAYLLECSYNMTSMWKTEDNLKIFYFQNVNDEDTITTASLYAELVYDQAEWEDIAEFR